jgi:hypothetical protein
LEWVGALLPSALVVILLYTAVPVPNRLALIAGWSGAAAAVIAKVWGSPAHLAIGAAVAVAVFFAAVCWHEARKNSPDFSGGISD